MILLLKGLDIGHVYISVMLMFIVGSSLRNLLRKSLML